MCSIVQQTKHALNRKRGKDMKQSRRCLVKLCCNYFWYAREAQSRLFFSYFVKCVFFLCKSIVNRATIGTRFQCENLYIYIGKIIVRNESGEKFSVQPSLFCQIFCNKKFAGFSSIFSQINRILFNKKKCPACSALAV